MTSAEMRAYGEANARPDMVLHSACVEQRERLDALGDDFIDLSRIPLCDTLPNLLQVRINNMKIFLLAGAWNFGEFPQDGVFAEAARIMAEVAVVCGGQDRLNTLLGLEAMRRELAEAAERYSN